MIEEREDLEDFLGPWHAAMSKFIDNRHNRKVKRIVRENLNGKVQKQEEKLIIRKEILEANQNPDGLNFIKENYHPILLFSVCFVFFFPKLTKRFCLVNQVYEKRQMLLYINAFLAFVQQQHVKKNVPIQVKTDQVFFVDILSLIEDIDDSNVHKGKMIIPNFALKEVSDFLSKCFESIVFAFFF